MRTERHQSISEILEASSPEQKIIWEHLMLITGENCAVRKIFYQGATAGSEFAAYFNSKLYLAYSFIVTFPSNNAGNGVLQLFDQANALCFQGTNSAPYWNSTAAAYYSVMNDYEIKNFIFSRAGFSIYNYCRFIGYRIIY